MNFRMTQTFSIWKVSFTPIFGRKTVSILGASQVAKNPAGDEGDAGSVPGVGRAPGGGNETPLQCSCQEYSMDRGVWWATADGVAKSWPHMSILAHMQIPFRPT